MPPLIALFVWIVFILVMLRLDFTKDTKPSSALWIPLTWMLIIGSRLPSQWIGGTHVGVQAQALEDGNPLDRIVFSVLILLAIVVLVLRSFKWFEFCTRNSALILLLSFALLSMVWSDFPFIAFKRWFRDLGNYLVILVAVSDPRPLEAVRILFRRLGYILVTLSILLNKYFPSLSKQYDYWSGVGFYSGATTSKNMLGVVCLISGAFFFWDTLTRWSDRKDRHTKRIILTNILFFGLTLWLLSAAKSATCNVCLVIGCFVILAAHSGWGSRHKGILKVLIPATFCLYLILAFGLDLNGEMAGQVGRNPTLTDRTLIWKTVLGLDTNPVVGTGYESFWLGPRLLKFYRRSGLYGLNEAHNGYLEIYLNLGLIGDFFFGVFMLASYWTIWQKSGRGSHLASLGLSMWIITLFYNMTEAAAMKGHLMWLAFLFVAITVPERVEEPAFTPPTYERAGATQRVLTPPLEVARQRR